MQIQRFKTKQRMSKAVIYNGVAYLCGQVAKDRTKDIKEQTASMLENVEEILKDIGSEKNKILSATIYLKDISLFTQMNEIWDNWVEEGHAPARACVEAKMSSPELLVEVTVIVAI